MKENKWKRGPGWPINNIVRYESNIDLVFKNCFNINHENLYCLGCTKKQFRHHKSPKLEF